MPANTCEVESHGGFAYRSAATILVTGGTGLVGMGIKMALESCGMEMANETWIFLGRKDADLTDLDATRELFAKYKPTHVVNLAAVVGGLLKNMKCNLEFFQQNLAIISNVLKCCHEQNVEFCISCMSTCIYPDKTTYPIDETMLHNGPPHESNFGYAYAKRMIDILNRGYAQQHGRNYTSAIACSVFGPFDNFSLTDGHVIPALMHKVELAKRNNTPLDVYGSGRALRQFIYNLDLGKLFIWAVRNYRETEPIMLSVDEDEEISIGDVVKFVTKVLDFEGEVIFDTSKPEGQLKKNASNSKLRQFLPSFKFTPFEEAIKETAEWFKRNYDHARR